MINEGGSLQAPVLRSRATAEDGKAAALCPMLHAAGFFISIINPKGLPFFVYQYINRRPPLHRFYVKI